MDENWMEKESLEFFQDIRFQIRDLKPVKIADLIGSLVRKHEDWIDRSCINLFAATNRMSPRAQALLSSAVATRAGEGHPGSKHQKGVKYLEAIEAIVIELAKKVFRANYMECRVLSGSIANLVAFNAMTNYGETIMVLGVPDGGHISYQKFGVAGYRGLAIKNIPFDWREMNINVDKLAGAVREAKPKLLVLGGSLILFPYPIGDVRKIADDVGSAIMYDGAHVDGLIAGGQFQDPLNEGADVFTGSTYKTLAGPPGGLVLCNNERLAREIDKAAFPGITANAHYHRLAALAVTLAELLEYGNEYATQVIRNAKALGKELDDDGFDVLASHKGYTASHQVVLDVCSFSNGHDAANLLEKANIICNSNLLPKDSLDMVRRPSGLRLGVQEVTRLGMKEGQMKEIAEFMRMVLLDHEDPVKVRGQVIDFRRDYTHVEYCFRV